MFKKVSENQKRSILDSFRNGTSIKEIALINKFTVSTIARQLKKLLGEDEFKLIKQLNSKDYNQNDNVEKSASKIDKNVGYSLEDNFIEIAPLSQEIVIDKQKDLSSQQISQFNFPNIAYMIVNHNIELYSKTLKDYPNWQFLSVSELERETIEIFVDLKTAKRSCSKDQKVIKVPNTNVFKIVAPILVSRGITRLISEDNLIAL